MASLLDRAIVFAVDAHAGMLRKGTQTPYIAHPLEALAIAAGITVDEEVLAAAVLHDVLEDTAVTAEQMRSEFGDRVLALVQSDSEDKREDRPAAETWHERKQETIDFLREKATQDEKIIALADKLANIRAKWSDQLKIGDELWMRFNMKDKANHRWYYCEIAKALEDLDHPAPCPAYKDFCAMIEKVFG